MRTAVFLLALVAFTATGRADERNTPALGMKLTYRFTTLTTIGGRTFGGGMVYTYVVTASDGKTAEGIIKPVAQITRCNGPADILCRDIPNAHIEGDLLTRPIPSDAAEGLAKHSHFKLVDFLSEERKFPFPASRDPKNVLGEAGPDPDFVLTNTLRCDLSPLAAFVPVGKAPHVALDCEAGVERTASRTHNIAAQSSKGPVTYDITYTGDGWVTLPSGNWEVKKLAFKMMPKDPALPASSAETFFSPQLGAVVKTHLVGKNPSAKATSENTTELISVTP